MIRHILIWKLNAETLQAGKRQEAIAAIIASADTLRGQIDGLLCAELCENAANSPYELVYYTEFRDAAALAAYQTHPLHEAHKARCAKWLDHCVVGDVVSA